MGWGAWMGRRWIVAPAAVLVILLLGCGAAAAYLNSGFDAPAVEQYSPQGGQEVDVRTPVSISFDRPVLAPLAERALRIEPATEGSISWEGNTMLFTPRAGWARGGSYNVTLDQSARGLLPLPLKESVSFQFMVAKDLAVATVQPEDGASEVAADSLIAVQFSYPIVPLGTSADGPNPVRVEPAPAGSGRWLTTSLYLFKPESGLAPGTNYRVTVAKGLSDTGGSALAADYSWSFTTKSPSVAKVAPEENTRYVGPDSDVRVTFDQPVDHDSAQQRFSLQGPTGAAVPGDFSWEADVLVFKPSAPLKLATSYTASMATGVRSAHGGGESKEFSWDFTTVGLPGVDSTAPVQGEQRHPAYDPIQITFSTPMDTESVEKGLSLSPKPPQEWFPGWQDSDTRLFIWGGLKPSTTYTLTLDGGVLDRYGRPLGKPLKVVFTTAPLPPRLNAAIPGLVGTFNATGSPVLYVEHVNVSRLDLALYRVNQADFLRLSSGATGFKGYQPGEGNLVRRWSEKTASVGQNESGLTSTNLAGAKDARLPSGYYLVRIQSPEGVMDDRLLMVSRLGLTVKRSQSQVLVWATDLSSGGVVSELPIRITDRDGKTLATGSTDGDGVLTVENVLSRDSAGRMVPIWAFAEGEGDLGAAGSEWAEGIRPYEFGLPYEPYQQPYRGYLYTDRPIYRPGQKVLFKGIVRADDDAHYDIPPRGTQVDIVVTDSQGRKVLSQTARLSDMGSFDGELAMSDSASLGNYYVSARIGNWGFGVNFSVAEYRKPEFEVQVGTERDSYLQGEQIAADGNASYYFGQPVAGAGVQWRVTSRDYIFSPKGFENYQFVDYDLLRAAELQGDRVRTEGKATADARGGYAFAVPADLAKDPLSQLFTIETSVSDTNNQQVSGRTEVVVHKGDYYPGLRPQRYVAQAGTPAAVDLVVVDRNGKPVPNAPLSVSFYNRKWMSVKERQPDGSYIWSSKPEDTPLSTRDLKTDAQGKTTAVIEAKEAGTIRVVAEVADPVGNRVRSATYLYISGSGFAPWQMENTDRLELVPDKKEYSTGETARVLVPSPVADALALVTVERGNLLSHRLVRLKGNSDVLEVPILPEYLPNVYLSVVLFKGAGAGGTIADFRVGYGELKVVTAEKSLKITVSPEKPRYQPGETAEYRLKVTDSSGKGVPAELSMAVVDSSVLALADDNSGKMLDSFWGRRALGVSTGSTLGLSVDRRNADLARENKGAGGGGDVPTVRREFPDTAFWAPAIRTDGNGEARVVVPMPDSLTTWKAMVRGVTATTQVGSGTAEVVIAKDLLLRPAFPRFLLMGDELKLATLIHNYTDKEVEAEVSLSAKGVLPQDGNAFAVQRVKVPVGGQLRLEWPARVESVPGGVSRAVLTLTAKPITAGVPQDSVEITLPVNPPATAEVVATSGEVHDSTTELVRVPKGTNTALGELTIETSPSLAAGMRYSARFLDEFPYECTEQTVSRFLPRVVMQRAFDKLGLPDPEGISGRLPDIVARSLQRLYSGQGPDGGWGWWPGEGSDQWITAYVLQGLAEARRAGYSVDQGVVDRAAKFLRGSLDAPSDVLHPENPNSRAYVLYALSLAGRGDLGLTNALFDRRSALGQYGRAFLLMALQSMGGTGQDGKVKSLVSDLSAAAVTSATGAHWEEQNPDPRTMNTNTRSTAVVLDSLVMAAPDSPLIPSAVRWLMVARKEGHWETTQETAMSLLALTDYLEPSGELKGDYSYRVELNGRELTTQTVKPGGVDESKRLVVEVKDLLSGADNRVNLARAKPTGGQSGDGKLYYTMHLRYFSPAEKVPAVSEGLALVREYYRLGQENTGPVSEVAPGETVKVKLTLVALRDLHYLVVEDPLPSGLEAVDTRLKTSSLVAQEETGGRRVEEAEKQQAEGGKFGMPWWTYDYFSHVEPRDDRVALFADYLPKGTYEYTYLAQATSEGRFQALPASGYEMYFPEVRGSSEGATFTVR